jgi:glycosyltransferase involved in cell wall biosynthesis
MVEAPVQTGNTVAVAIPTRSRPEELSRCLDRLAVARERLNFPVYVCDSSPTEADRAATREVCERRDWVSLHTHEGTNVAAARNACARAAQEDLLVNVDDDLELEPEAIDRLVACYEEGESLRVVSGSVSWDGLWTRPMKIRTIGYSRPPEEGEKPDFVLGAFFLYPRSFALTWPWNERCDTSDDIFMGALWRRHRVQLLFCEDARALHPELPTNFDPTRMGAAVRNQRWHIYGLLFDTLIANPSLRRTLAYETLGFMASAKLYLWRPRWALPFLWSWTVGHLRLLADSRYLRALVRREPRSDER